MDGIPPLVSTGHAKGSRDHVIRRKPSAIGAARRRARWRRRRRRRDCHETGALYGCVVRIGRDLDLVPFVAVKEWRRQVELVGGTTRVWSTQVAAVGVAKLRRHVVLARAVERLGHDVAARREPAPHSGVQLMSCAARCHGAHPRRGALRPELGLFAPGVHPVGAARLEAVPSQLLSYF